MKSLIIKPGREKSLVQRHPWVFSGAVESVTGDPQLGETVAVISQTGEQFGWAAYSPKSKIIGRMWAFDPNEIIDDAFIEKRIHEAINLRTQFLPKEVSNAYRLIFAESDQIPGLVVDKYADCLVVQILSQGAEFWKQSIIDSLVKLFQPKVIYERSDVEVRKLEGMPEFTGILYGQLPGQKIEIQENGVKFAVDIVNGQKTGFYLDQRANRNEIQSFVEGKDVLNCFAYTGGFTLFALTGGARQVTSIDSSKEFIDQAKNNLELNGLEKAKATWIVGDVFQELRKFRDQNQTFDVIILDPPKFAPTQAQVEKAARGYKDINLLAFKLLRPGGILFTFSCSGGIGAELFQKIVAGAALDAGADARIIKHLHQDMDHPISLNFPESEYLKGLICLKT